MGILELVGEVEWEKEQEQWTQMQFGIHHNSNECGTVEMSGCGSHTMAWNTEKQKHPQEKKTSPVSPLSPSLHYYRNQEK